MQSKSKKRQKLAKSLVFRRRLFEALESRRLLSADHGHWDLFDHDHEDHSHELMHLGHADHSDHWHHGWQMSYDQFVAKSLPGPLPEGAYEAYLEHFGEYGGEEIDGEWLFVEPSSHSDHHADEFGGDSEIAFAALSDTFRLHSLPNANHTIYLDFDGHVTEGTTWNAASNITSIVSPAYDPENNGPAFSNSELTRIQGIWKRVAEDFSMFEVNVTTEDPGAAALSRTGGGDQKWGSRVVITEDWDNCSCGGFAYLNSFNDSVDEPVFVFTTSAIGVSAATSHEVGHALSLRHDGLTTGVVYYNGHGSGQNGWGPIMGSGYYKNVTTWDTGEYFQANNSENDWLEITGSFGFGFRSDDHGANAVNASDLEIVGINSSDPTLVDVDDFGIITLATDQDWFTFETWGGEINLTIDSYVQETFVSNGGGFTRSVESSPSNQGSNLNVQATIYDSNENFVARSEPASSLNASFNNLNLPKGTYFLEIDGVGYGNWAADPPSGFDESVSRGQYRVSGTLVGPSQLLVAVDDTALTVTDTPVAIAVLDNDYDPQNGSFSITAVTTPGNGGASESGGVIIYTPNPGFVGTDTFSYTITDDQGETASAIVTVLITPPKAPILFVDDDLGATFERFYTAALDANARSYDDWHVETRGLPTASDLAGYSVVIWNTGFAYSGTGAGLTAEEQTTLSSYLDEGGSLFLIGQDILYNGVTSTFQNQYLKLANFTSDVRNLSQFVGVSGSPISDGMNLSFSLPSDYTADWSDSLVPTPAGEGVFYRNAVNGEAQPFNTIAYDGSDFRVVFMAAAFEGISTSDADPNNQAFVMNKVLNFLSPAPVATGEVIVSAPTPGSVTGEDGSSVSFNVELNEMPTANVSISVASSDTSEGTVDVSELVFTPVNWNIPQTVTVIGVDDAVVDGDVVYAVEFGSAVTVDPNFLGVKADDVSLINADNDVATLTLSLGAGSVAEGSTLVGTVLRNTPTTAPLVVNLSSDDTTEATVPSSVTIPAGDSSVEFVISGVEDLFVDGDQPATISASTLDFVGDSGTVIVLDTSVATLSLTLADSVISEAGGSTTGTVSRNSVGEAVTVNVLSSDETEAVVGSVTLAANETSGVFTITAVDDTLVDGDQTVTITVNALSYVGASKTLTVTDDEDLILTMTLDASSVAENGTISGTVTRNTETTNSLVVNLSSSDVGEASVPSTLTIDVGQSSATFTVTGVADGIVDGDQSVTLTAESPNFLSGIATVIVTDVDLPTLSLTLDPSSISESGGVAVATLSRNTLVGSELVVDLESSDWTAATVPSSVTIPSDQTSVTFNVTAVDDAIADGDQTTLLTASTSGYESGTASLLVVDDETPTLFVLIAESSISEAGGVSSATVTRNTPTTDPLVVDLVSDDPGEASVPSTVTIPAGDSTVSFEVQGVDDSFYDQTQTAVITASAAGFLSTSDLIFVTDDDPAPPSILFVDDDLGATFERFYTAALDANVRNYDEWEVETKGVPSFTDLAGYSVVIWNTGYAYSGAGAGLTAAEQTALSSYLDEGGSLFLIGQDILFNGVTSTFQNQYLKLANFTSDVRNLSQFVGVSGSPISDGMNLSFNLPSDYPADWSDSLLPTSAGQGVFYRNAVNSEYQPFNTIAYDGSDFRVVFMAAAFEGISTSDADPNNQTFVMKKVLDFLAPPPVATGQVIVSAPTPGSVTGEDGSSVSFTVELSEIPTANVSISVGSSDTSEGTVDVSELVFTPGNWNIPQTVTVTGVDDAVVDGDVVYAVEFGSAVTFDPNFAGVKADDVSLINADNDVATLTLSLGAGSVAEGSTLVGTVLRNTPTTASLVVNLSSDDTTEATVPASVTIPVGESSMEFVISGVEDLFVDGDQPATISASSLDFIGASGTVIVLDTSVPALSLTLADSVISEAGGSTTGTVSRNSVGEPLTVNIVSSDETEAVVGSVTLAANETSGTFTVTAVDDTLVDGDQTVTITASALSYVGASETLTVTDDEELILEMTLDASSVAENGTISGTVSRNTETTNSLVVNLSSSDVGEASVPATLTIEVGQSSANFTVTGVVDGIVDGDQSVTLTAESTNFLSGTATVIVTDVDVPTLSLTLDPSSISESGGVAVATLSRNTPVGTELVVDLASSDLTAATVPSSVTIPSDQTSVTFSVTAVDDAIADGDQTTLLTASSSGYDSGTASLLVVDDETPTLFVLIAEPSISEAGGVSSATVSRNTPTTDPLVVGLVSDDPGEASVPSTVTIPAGVSSVSFEVQGVDDSFYDQTQTAVITPIFSGFLPISDWVFITDDEAPLLTVSIPADNVDEGATTTGIVSHNFESTDPFTVTLASSDETEAYVPANVTIPQGQTSVGFNITGVLDGIVDGTQVVSIIGSAPDVGSSSDELEVLDINIPALTLQISAADVAEDGVVTATVTRNTDVASSLIVDLISSDPGEASVPASVTIAAGQSSVDFLIFGVSDGIIDGTQTVQVTASSSELIPDARSLNVLDIDFQTQDLYYFATKNGGVVNGDTFQEHDILAYDGNQFRIIFDGTPWVDGLEIDGFHILGDNSILMSFATPGFVTGTSLYFDDSDILLYVPDSDTWLLAFDGSDVGLSTNGEDIDAIGLAPDGRLVISTSGSVSVGNLSASDEDLLVFNADSVGSDTSGNFEMYFDGSDVGLSTSASEDVDAVSLGLNGSIYLSTRGAFSVSGISGNDEDVFVFDAISVGINTVGSFQSQLYFDGSEIGVFSDIIGFQVVETTPLLLAGLAMEGEGVAAVGGVKAEGDPVRWTTLSIRDSKLTEEIDQGLNTQPWGSVQETPFGPMPQFSWSVVSIDPSTAIEELESDLLSDEFDSLACKDHVFAQWDL